METPPEIQTSTLPLQLFSRYVPDFSDFWKKCLVFEQELRVSQVIETMLEHVENLKRTYHTEHRELQEARWEDDESSTDDDSESVKETRPTNPRRRRLSGNKLTGSSKGRGLDTRYSTIGLTQSSSP